MENEIKIREICCGKSYNLSGDFNGVCYGFGYNDYVKCRVDIQKNSILSSQRLKFIEFAKLLNQMWIVS